MFPMSIVAAEMLQHPYVECFVYFLASGLSENGSEFFAQNFLKNRSIELYPIESKDYNPTFGTVEING